MEPAGWITKGLNANRSGLAGQGARFGAAARRRPPRGRRGRDNRRARAAGARDFGGGQGLLRALGLPGVGDRADDVDDYDRGSAENARAAAEIGGFIAEGETRRQLVRE